MAVLSFVAHAVQVHVQPGLGRHAPVDFLALISGTTTFVAVQVLIHVASGPWTRLSAILRALHLLFFWFVCAYLHNTRVGLDYAVIATNVEFPLSMGYLHVVVAGMSWVTLAISIPLVVAAAAWDVRLADRVRSPDGFRWAIVTGLAGVVAASCVVPVRTIDEPVNFARSALDYARGASRYCEPLDSAVSGVSHGPARDLEVHLARTPDVFVVVVESLSAGFVGSTTRDGRPVMPFLASLRNRHWYVDRFYAHSVQTAKGHFALFTSVVPSISGVEFQQHPALRVDTLPGVLRAQGYRTVYLQAQDTRNFNNTAAFLLSHGFDAHARARDYLSAREAVTAASGWGVTDESLYLAAWRWLAEIEAGSAPERPLFMAIATVESHQPFNIAPEDRKLYVSPVSLAERQANALYLADRGLRHFVEALGRHDRYRDAVVVITGDHAFPTGLHGLEHNEAGFFEEFFRVPLFILDPGGPPPRRLAGPYAQIDVGPTLLDLLGARERVAGFRGQSMLSASPAPVWLVQPYAGTYLAVVDGAFKFVRHLRTGREYLFDLERDPMERVDLLEAAAPPEAEAARARLSADIDLLIVNHCAIEQDRLMVAGPAPAPP